MFLRRWASGMKLMSSYQFRKMTHYNRIQLKRSHEWHVISLSIRLQHRKLEINKCDLVLWTKWRRNSDCVILVKCEHELWVRRTLSLLQFQRHVRMQYQLGTWIHYVQSFNSISCRYESYYCWYFVIAIAGQTLINGLVHRHYRKYLRTTKP